MTQEKQDWHAYIDGLSDAQRHHLLTEILKQEMGAGGDSQIRFRPQQTPDHFPHGCDVSPEGLQAHLYWQSCGTDLLEDFPGERTMEQIIESPQKGDLIVIIEPVTDNKESFDHESMLRVLGVADDLVWFKEYGVVGRVVRTLKQWMNRIRSAKSASVYKHKAD